MNVKMHPQILGLRTVARSRIFRVEAVQLRFGNGEEREFERIAAPAVAATVIVVAVPSPGKVLLVREYAVGLQRYELGLPMGRIDEGESMLEAANRELREETGFSARNLLHLSTLSLAPGILAYQADVVLATDLVADLASTADEPEAPEVITASLGNVQHLIASGGLTEARSLAALFIAREHVLPQPSLLYAADHAGGSNGVTSEPNSSDRQSTSDSSARGPGLPASAASPCRLHKRK